jgi:hypothetical protein
MFNGIEEKSSFASRAEDVIGLLPFFKGSIIRQDFLHSQYLFCRQDPQEGQTETREGREKDLREGLNTGMVSCRASRIISNIAPTR